MELTVEQRKNRDPGSGMAVVDREALGDLAERTESYVGADVEAVYREGAQIAVREYVRSTRSGLPASVDDIELMMDHFEQALEAVDAGAEDDTGPQSRSPGQSDESRPGRWPPHFVSRYEIYDPVIAARVRDCRNRRIQAQQLHTE